MVITGTIKTIKQRLGFIEEGEKLYDCTIVEHRNKRSHNANNYLWELVGELADVMRMSKDEMYLMMLKRYGQSQQIAVKQGVDISRVAKYTERGDTANGWTYWKIFIGSSQYNTKEMAILIDGVVMECREQDIPTLDDRGLTELKDEWGNE